MADALTIAGIPLRVVENSWTQRTLYQGPALQRMAEGNLVDGRYAPARVCECVIWFVSQAEESALRSAIPVGIPQTIAGELPEDGFDGTVDISQTQKLRRIIPGLGDVLVRAASLHIEEAEPA